MICLSLVTFSTNQLVAVTYKSDTLIHHEGSYLLREAIYVGCGFSEAVCSQSGLIFS
jgi:hypothetical protein